MRKNLDKRIQDIPAYIWTRIAQIDEHKGLWTSYTRIPASVQNTLKQSVLITSTGASTRIEGSALSDQDVENLMRGISIDQFADRDAQEVRGYYELLQNVFESYGDIRFSESTVQHFHQELLKYTEKDNHHRGAYKKVENKVHLVDQKGDPHEILFDTTPVYLTPIEMKTLMEWVYTSLQKKQTHPLITIASCIVEFLHIHPFQDGNGRLSRILTNMLMLQAGYSFMQYVSHEKIIEEQKQGYYMALRKSQKTFRTRNETIEPWLDFFTARILNQAHRAVELLNNDYALETLSPIQLRVWEYVQKHSEVTPKQIAEELHIVRITVGQALEKLMSLNLIKRYGEGRATRYRKT